jgi:hypothetical protein
MITVRSHDLWSELAKFADRTTGIKAAVAYVSDDTSIKFGEGDVLVVDASNETIASGGTSAKLLSRAFEAGASLFSNTSLHAKVMVCDGRAYIGSANVSKNSKKLLEVGVISDHPKVLSGATQFIDKLSKQSDIIDRNFIEAILKIPVKVGGGGRKAPKQISIDTSRTWLISVVNEHEYPLDERKVLRDMKLVKTKADEEATYIWLRKGSRCYREVSVGDSVVVIGRDESASKEPENVYRHFTIQRITIDNGIKSIHYAWSGKYVLPWTKFVSLAERAGITQLRTGLTTNRELDERQSSALFELWQT